MKIQEYVGLDVHKVNPPPAAPKATRDKTTVAIAEGDRNGEVRVYGEISSDLVTTGKALRKIRGRAVQGVNPLIATPSARGRPSNRTEITSAQAAGP